jgi:hypothetical protein
MAIRARESARPAVAGPGASARKGNGRRDWRRQSRPVLALLALWLASACSEEASPSDATDVAADSDDATSDGTLGEVGEDAEDDASSGGPNVLSPAGDFELLDGWAEIPGTDFAGGLDYEVTRSGSGASRHLWSTVDGFREGYTAWTITLPADRYAGRRVQFQTWLRLNNAVALPSLTAKAASGEVLHSSFGDRLLQGTLDWTELRITQDIEEEADTLTFGIALYGLGELWLDDTVVLEVDSPLSVNMLRRDPVNLGFEEGGDPVFERPLGWGYIGRASPDTAGITTRDSYEGVAAGELRSSEYGLYGFNQQVRAVDYRGETVRWRAHVKAESVTGQAGLWMQVSGVGYALVSSDNMTDRPIGGTSDWAEYEIVLPVAADAWRIDFGVYLDGTGSLLIDAGHLQIVRP